MRLLLWNSRSLAAGIINNNGRCVPQVPRGLLLFSSAGRSNNGTIGRHMSMFHKIFGGKEKIEQRRKENKDKRDAIISEMKQMSPLKEFKLNKGKRSEAPPHLVPTSEAAVFPPMSLVSGKDTKAKKTLFPGASLSKPTVVLMSFRAIGEPMMAKYAESFASAMSMASPQPSTTDSKPIELMQVLVLESFIHRMTKSAIANGLHKSEVATLMDNINLVEDKIEELSKALNLFTPLTCYCFVLDTNGHIVWRAHGMPSEGEVHTIKTVVVPSLLNYNGHTQTSRKTGHTTKKRPSKS